MDIPTNLPSDKLHDWAYAVHYSQLVLQQQITKLEALGLACNYDRLTVTRLQELEKNLGDAWSAHMTELDQRASQARLTLEELLSHD